MKDDLVKPCSGSTLTVIMSKPPLHASPYISATSVSFPPPPPPLHVQGILCRKSTILHMNCKNPAQFGGGGDNDDDWSIHDESCAGKMPFCIGMGIILCSLAFLSSNTQTHTHNVIEFL